MNIQPHLSPMAAPAAITGRPFAHSGVATPDAVLFSGKRPGKKPGLGTAITTLLAAGAVAVGGWMMGVPGPTSNVTQEKVYEIDANRHLSLTDYDVVVDQTAQGWEVRGNRKFDITGFRFSLNPTTTAGAKAWEIRGKSTLGMREYVATLTPGEKGSWTLNGDKEGTPGYGDFGFTITPDGAGGYKIEGDKAFTMGGYDFTVTPTDQGWKIKGGADLKLDFRFEMTRENPAQGSPQEIAQDERALAVAVPVILTLAREMDK